MKPVLPICLPVVLLIVLCLACNSASPRNTGNLSPRQFLADAHDTAQPVTGVLEKYMPLVHRKAADTGTFFLGDDMMDDDSLTRQMLVGRFINKQDILAISVSTADTAIRFFLLDQDTWKPAGMEKTNIPVYRIGFEDMDNDGNDEIITATAQNMNGNRWMEVYHFSPVSHKISYAGNFSTDYKIDKYKKQVAETYEGSWYMDQSKALYQWQHDQLIPVKAIILAHDTANPENGKLSFEYYENPSGKLEGLVLKHTEPYKETKKQKELWDNFFAEEQQH